MIRLESISISRFRGIREGKVEGFADVNLFIGRNNSGKSTVAEAITRILSRLANQSDALGRQTAEEWLRVRNALNAPESEQWYKQDQTKPIELTAALAKQVFSAEWLPGKGGFELKANIPPIAPKPSDNLFWDFACRVTVFRLADAGNQGVENTLWQRLLTNRRDKVLTKAVNDIFRIQVEQLQLLPNSRFFLLFEDCSLSLDVQGDGGRAALRCLMMLTAIQKTLFIMEEPECHQHPGSLERFAEAVCRIAKEQEVQLLISTHSLECVDKFLQAAKAAGSESAVFHLKLTDGLLQSTRLNGDTVGTLEATGIDVRNLDLYG